MKRILIVDDCDEFREVVAEFLRDAGYAVELAGGEQDACDLCAKQHFDLILCDLVLPVADAEPGFEDENDSPMAGVHVMHLLSKKYPQTPIVVISGYLTGASLRGISKFGAVSCLSKPFSRDELLGTLAGVFAAQPRQGS